MQARFLFSLLLLVGLVGKSTAQTLFLPSSLNTVKNDHPVEFAEYHGAYYFVGTQWPVQAGAASSGFCYKTDSIGNVLQTFQLNGIDSSKGYSFEAIYGYDDQIYVVATEGRFQHGGFLSPASEGGYDGYFYNKIIVLRFNLNLGLNRVDTLRYDVDRSDVQIIKSVRIGSRIFMAYSGQGEPDTVFYPIHSFISVYNTGSGSFTHQLIDSTFLLSASASVGLNYGNEHRITAVTRTGNEQLLLSCFLLPNPSFHDYFNVLQMDTNLNITALPFSVISNSQQRGALSFSSEYIEFWKPTVTSSYFGGPLFFQDTSAASGCQGYNFSSVARLNAARQSITVGTQVTPRNPQRGSYWQSSKNPITLLNNKTHFVLSGQALAVDLSHQPDSAYIWISKYDTSLNLIWTRNFEKSGHFFNAAGVHELQDGRLLVIASATDTASTNGQDLYCFIIDSNGTPLNSFSIASPAQKGFKIYPNPARDAIRFESSTGQGPTVYRVVDMQGKVLLEGNAFTGNPVSVSALPPASYILQAHGNDGIWHAALFTKE